MTISFKGGRLPEQPDKPRLQFSALLSGVTPTYKPLIDWLTKVSSYPMYGNDQYGDCVWAMIGHEIQSLTQYGQGHAVTISQASVLKGYSDVTGFNPKDPSTDQGTNIQDALNYWRKTGVGGHKILGFARVDVKNPAEVKAATELFGTLALGINFPGSAMDQFNDGEEWTVVKGASVEGGHAIALGKYDTSSYSIVTWGAIQRMDQGFWDKYVEEAWVIISQEWLDANNNSPEGVNMTELGKQFTALTGEASPFPATPTPAPTPTPTPATDPDAALLAFAPGWLKVKRTAADNKQLHNLLQAWYDKHK